MSRARVAAALARRGEHTVADECDDAASFEAVLLKIRKPALGYRLKKYVPVSCAPRL